MSEIKNIKEWLVKVDLGNWIAQEDCSNCGGNGFKVFDGESGYERDECHCLIPESRVFNANAHIWMESLITTIESQNSQIESLKAITELAVKGLKQISEADNNSLIQFPRAMVGVADIALEEIRRLQNAQT